PIAPGTNFSGHRLTGLDSIPYLWSYFQSRNIDLSQFSAHNALVTSWSTAPFDTWHPNLAQRGTSEFLIYDPNAGSQGHSAQLNSTNTGSMSIDLTSATGTYQVEWYRPSDGTVQGGSTVSGGSQVTFTAPWKGTDVVLRLLHVLPGPIIVDNNDSGYSETGGPWFTESVPS